MCLALVSKCLAASQQGDFCCPLAVPIYSDVLQRTFFAPRTAYVLWELGRPERRRPNVGKKQGINPTFCETAYAAHQSTTLNAIGGVAADRWLCCWRCPKSPASCRRLSRVIHRRLRSYCHSCT